MSSPFEGPYSFEYGACPQGHPVNTHGRCQILNDTGKCEPPAPQYQTVVGYACLNCIKVIDVADVPDHIKRTHILILGTLVTE